VKDNKSTIETLVRKVQVKNTLGLHTRPATMIAKLVHNSKCDIFFTHKRDTVNAKSILSVLMLAAKKNSTITITVRGDAPEQVMNDLVNAFDTGFGELDG
jgi:phosphocarrier protein